MTQRPRPRSIAAGALVAIGALLSSGCERAIFGVANRGTPAPTDTVVYATDTGLALDVYRPALPATDAAGLPVVVFFYGGSWERGSREQYGFVGSRLAENGVLAVVADYRTFPRAGFPDFMHDGARAVAWVRSNAARYGGNPDRVFLAGHSAGAQIAALLGTDGRYLAREGLRPDALAGVIGLSGPYDFAITGKYRAVFGPPAQWPDAQAINFVDGGEPPFLLVHGDGDRVVEARDSVDLDARLRASGVGSTLLLIPGAGHFAPAAAFYDTARSPLVLPAVLRFIAEN